MKVLFANFKQQAIDSWKKTYSRFLKIRGNPKEIALGFALGLFVGMSPFMGAHTIIAVFLAAAGFGALLITQNEFSGTIILIFFVTALAYGLLMALPIGGADMPVVISLFNALTGLAVAFEGFVLNNAAMIIAGTVVGSAGTLLTQLMAKAMNRSIGNVLLSSFGAGDDGAADDVQGSKTRRNFTCKG